VREVKIGRRTLFGVHHPTKRTQVRLFVISDGQVEDVTQYIAKVTKLELVRQRKWVDVPKYGHNPVHRIAELFADATGRPQQKFVDLY